MPSNLVTIPNYRMTEQIYDGSRTRVYRGFSESDQQPVVIKLLKNEYPTFNELVQFRNQYTIIKNLDLAGIVKAIALLNYRNGFALVMEDFGGVSLIEEMERWEDGGMGRRADCLSEFFHIAIQIVQTLEGLYHNRVIHKDIKPHNILINPETRAVKLIDFSISSLLPRETQEIVNPNVLEGTLAYMSPEQTGRMNRGIDYRTDFYSLGVTFYELLTGKLPFQPNDAMELIHCHIARKPTPAIDLVPAIPQVVNDIIMKLMAKTAEERYQSAFGLRYDLERCWQQWQEDGCIRQFSVGERDICDRFVIPEKLYGRETEVATLLAAFNRVAGRDGETGRQGDGESEDRKTPAAFERGISVANLSAASSSSSTIELMLVTGFSGIGKTAVVNEVHKPIVRARGYFIKGKFDQFKRDIPLSAWVQAFQDLMRQLLTESAAALVRWKSKIVEVLGENAQVLIDIIPELELLIGKQPQILKLEGSAAQNRFNLLFGKFIQIFASSEHPLVIFLDDLQWADAASLKLMQLVMSEADTRYLLLIGAYRDNEVFPAHPLMLTLDEIRNTEVSVNQITLAPLGQPSLNQLIADTLSCAPERAVPLTELVLSKTKGNPFFTNQFLKALYEDGLISFDFSCGYRQCDIAQVRALSVSDDVVEFMALQLQKLPIATQRVLKLAACIGNPFDLATLAIVNGKSLAETATDLWKALQEGLIIPTSEVYKFFQEEEGDRSIVIGSTKASNPLPMTHDLLPTYKFLHDRVQQAAYSLIPEGQKQLTHLTIGRLLLSNTSIEEREEKIFDLVNQLNIGRELITDRTERDELAQLNLIAGRKAKASTAYVAAFGYLKLGLGLLAVDSWQNQYELTLALYVEAAEAAYLSGHFEEMEQLTLTVLQQAQSLLDKVKAYEVNIQACIAHNKQLTAIKTALPVLTLLGVEFPEQPTNADIQRFKEETRSHLARRQPFELIDLPTMSDASRLAAMRIMLRIIPASFQAFPELFPLIIFKQLVVSILYGNAAESIFAYVCYGLILCAVEGDIESGYQFGQLALNLLSRLNAKDVKARTIQVCYGHVQHWKEPVRATLKPFLQGYQISLETGDFEYVGYCLFLYSLHSYVIGKELAELQQEMAGYSETIAHFKQETALNYHEVTRQAVLNLMGRAKNPCDLIGEAYDAAEKLPQHQQVSDREAIFLLYFNKLTLCYLFHNYSQSVENAAQAEQYLDSVAGMIVVPIFHFYDSLAQVALYPNAPGSEQQKILQRLAANQEKLKTWAHHAPINHQHKFDLVEAERYRVLGQPLEAMDYYDKAISGAKENDYMNEEALAHELAAKFYLEWGKEKIAQVYLTDAYYAYARWGAKAKVDDLEKRYPQLLDTIMSKKNSLNKEDTFSSITTGTVTSSSGTSISAVLDFTAAIEASQVLSGEIQLDKLLSSLMQVVMENGGATKSALLMPQDGNLAIEALTIAAGASDEVSQARDSSGANATVLQSIPLHATQDIPVSIVNYVWRTQETLLLNDASTDTTFVADPYMLQHKPRSVLCIPIQNRGKAIAILYLENDLTPGVFTPDRLAVITVLSSQAAISIENAKLYAEVRQAERKYRSIFENALEGIFQTTPEGRYLSANPALVNLYGYDSPEELIAAISDISHQVYVEPQRRAEFSALIQQHGAVANFESQVYRKDGSIIWISENARAVRDANGVLLYYQGFIEDITERKQAETVLTQYNQILEQQVAERTQELSQALKHLKTTQDELVQSEKLAALGQLVAGIAHEINTPLGAIRASISNITTALAQSLQALPPLFQQLSSEQQANFFALLDATHHNQQCLSTREERQLKRTLKKELEARGFEQIDTLATALVKLGITGDIAPFIPLLQDECRETILETAYSLLTQQTNSQTIKLAVERASKIVFALKSYARQDNSGQMTQAKITEGMDIVLTLYHNQLKQGVELIKDYQDIPAILCYPEDLNQVWTNLIHNALQAMNNQGRLEIAVFQAASQVVVQVTDSGCGIPPDIQDKIFEPFFTTKPTGEGSGLGLGIVKKIVDKHQGKIEVESQPGRTTFSVWLPIE